MVCRCAKIAFGIALVVALSYATAHAQRLKADGGSVAFSTPCAPASFTFQAKSDSEVISTVDSIFASKTAEAPNGSLRALRVEAVGCLLAPQAFLTYAPLLRRPPPLHS
jgi:hypothetical protein